MIPAGAPAFFNPGISNVPIAEYDMYLVPEFGHKTGREIHPDGCLFKILAVLTFFIVYLTITRIGGKMKLLEKFDEPAPKSVLFNILQCLVAVVILAALLYMLSPAFLQIYIHR